MAVSRRSWEILTKLDFQPQCDFDGTESGDRCHRAATYALWRVPCDCKDLQRVYFACIRCKRWLWKLRPATCADCGHEFEPTGKAAFDQVQRLTPR